MNRNRTEQLQEVVAALCDKLTSSGKEQQRDVASLGLKTVVTGARGWAGVGEGEGGGAAWLVRGGGSAGVRHGGGMAWAHGCMAWEAWRCALMLCPPLLSTGSELSPKKASVLVGTATPKLIEGLKSQVCLGVVMAQAVGREGTPCLCP